MSKSINISRISIFKRRADILYLRGFWGDKSRGTKSTDHNAHNLNAVNSRARLK